MGDTIEEANEIVMKIIFEPNEARIEEEKEDWEGDEVFEIEGVQERADSTEKEIFVQLNCGHRVPKQQILKHISEQFGVKPGIIKDPQWLFPLGKFSTWY